MAVTTAVCNTFKTEVLKGEHDFAVSQDKFKIALYQLESRYDYLEFWDNKTGQRLQRIDGRGTNRWSNTFKTVDQSDEKIEEDDLEEEAGSGEFRMAHAKEVKHVQNS